MARRIPADRFRQLVDCATQAFIEQGYARTQMADLAEAMGVAKGTLYLCAESKGALFDLVVRSLAAEHPIITPPKLAHPTPRPAYLENRSERKLLRPVPDITVAARVILEMIVTWAVHRHWDPAPKTIDDQIAEDTAVQFIVGGLTQEVQA